MLVGNRGALKNSFIFSESVKKKTSNYLKNTNYDYFNTVIIWRYITNGDKNVYGYYKKPEEYLREPIVRYIENRSKMIKNAMHVSSYSESVLPIIFNKIALMTKHNSYIMLAFFMNLFNLNYFDMTYINEFEFNRAYKYFLNFILSEYRNFEDYSQMVKGIKKVFASDNGYISNNKNFFMYIITHLPSSNYKFRMDISMIGFYDKYTLKDNIDIDVIALRSFFNNYVTVFKPDILAYLKSLDEFVIYKISSKKSNESLIFSNNQQSIRVFLSNFFAFIDKHRQYLVYDFALSFDEGAENMYVIKYIKMDKFRIENKVVYLEKGKSLYSEI